MITIGSAERVEELRERLAREFEHLRPEGVEVQMRTVRKGDLTFIGCDPVSRKPLTSETDRRFRLLVANALSDLIVNRWEGVFLRRLIRSHYGYFDPGDQEQIYAYAARALHPQGEGVPSVSERIRRKGRILARLSEFLDKNTELVVDGFVTFRMKDYVEEMEEAVDLAVEEFLMEKEQEEFVRLLRTFVDAQEPRLPLVNLLFAPGGGFRLLNASGQAVTTPQLESLGLDPGRPGDEEEDLISALLALLPEVVAVHRRPQDPPASLLETLRGVFGERLVVCDGCRFCKDAPPAGIH